MPAGRDPAAAQAWWEAFQAWAGTYGGASLFAMLVAQWGQLAVIALYLAPGGRATTGAALLLALRRLPRFVLAGLVVAMPVGMLALVSASAPPLIALCLPLVVYLLGRSLLTGAALVARPGTGAVRSVVLSWRWTRGAGPMLALLVAALLVTVSVATQGAAAAVAVFGQGGGLAAQAFTAAVDAAAALAIWAATLALSMMQAVLYRRLAR